MTWYFPHHENEIAQSECFTGKQFSRYWVHNGMLTLSGEKMSKSIGNLVSIDEFLSKHSASYTALDGLELRLSQSIDLQ